jgi:hypothetical protein
MLYAVALSYPLQLGRCFWMLVSDVTMIVQSAVSNARMPPLPAGAFPMPVTMAVSL